MRVLVDADGCPVVDLTIRIAKGHGIPCFLICDTNHYFEREGATSITVSQGADSADYFIANMAQPGDVIVTGDYGLAALSLSKKARPISHDGLVYTDDNIGSLLEQRAMSAKIRRSGGRLSGPSKRTEEQNTAFALALGKLLGENETNKGAAKK